jgi:hypothetical protein
MSAEMLPSQIPNSQFVQLRLDVSTIVNRDQETSLDEVIVKVYTRRPFVQVADYWPRTEMYSSIVSPMSISESQDQMKQAWMRASGGYPGVGWGQGQAYYHDQVNRDVAFQQAPPMQVLTAAGTLERRSGVFFKLRSSPQSTLEGNRNFLLTLEVPSNWRGDLLEIEVSGLQTTKKETKVLSELHGWIAVYRQGDQEAAETAMAFVEQQSRLRSMASAYQSQIKRQAYPTPVHRLGQKLDIYQPLVSPDYLQAWMFGNVGAQPNGLLPVDLRVAMLDFIDSRRALEEFAQPNFKQALAGRTVTTAR